MGIFSLLAALGVLALLTAAHAMPQPGSDSSLEMSIENELMDEMTWNPKAMEESPENNEIPEDDHVTSPYQSSEVVLDDETEEMKAAKMCAKTVVDLDSFISDIDTLSNETRTAFFSQYCPRLEKTALCMHDMLKANRPNIEEDVFTIVKALTDKYPDLVDLICKNDGEMIFNLAEPTTKKCVENLWDDVKEFFLPFAFEPKLISQLTKTQCRTFSELRQYIEGSLNVCKAPDLMSVYDLFHNTLFSVTTCHNYAMPQSSEVLLDDGTESMLMAKMCAKTAVKCDSCLSDIDTLSNETRTEFFSQYCPRLERTTLCMGDMLKAVKLKVEEDDFIIFKALAEIYPELVDLICKNDGEMIFNLAEPITMKCVGKLWEDVMEYFLPFAFEPKLISLLTKTECAMLSKIRQNIKSQLNVCNAPALMSVYDLFHNKLFSVTTCRNYVLTETEAGLFAEANMMLLPGSNSSSEESTRESMEKSTGTRTFMGVVREVCRDNSGSDEAYIALTEAIGSAIVCVMTSVDVKNFISDVDTISNETRGTFFPEYCPQVKNAGSCLDDLLKATGPCLEEDDFKITLAVAGMYPDTVDLICKNDGEVIFTLAEPKTKECISELKDNVTECTEPFAVKSENWDISHLMPTQVGAFSELRRCIEGKLSVCEARGLISVYDVFHNTLFRLDSCTNVRPFLDKAFVPFVQYISTATKAETNTVY